MQNSRYYFTPSTYVFSALTHIAYLDRYPYKLTKKMHLSYDSPFISHFDFERIFAPDICPPKQGGDLYLCLPRMLEKYGYIMERLGEYYIFSKCCEADPGSIIQEIKEQCCLDETRGLIWCGDMNKLIPYRLCVPKQCGALPLVVGLHGGGGSPDEMFDATDNGIARQAVERGFLFLAADGGVRNSTYGCSVPPNGMKGNAFGFGSGRDAVSERDRSVSESGLLQTIEYIIHSFPIDRTRIFLMGNSMGGMGTFHFASRHRELFRAISPAGAAPDPVLFDASGLDDIPVFFVAGTEDHHGYGYLESAFLAYQSHGLNITLRKVEGGTHGSAWVDVLDEILDFFGL